MVFGFCSIVFHGNLRLEVENPAFDGFLMDKKMFLFYGFTSKGMVEKKTAVLVLLQLFLSFVFCFCSGVWRVVS